MDKVTKPPCDACNAHDILEDKFYEMKNENSVEHATITKSLGENTVEHRWIIAIGSSLVAGVGLVFAMVWALHTKENTTSSNIAEIKTSLKYVSSGIKETKVDVYRRLEDCEDEH